MTTNAYAVVESVSGLVKGFTTGATTGTSGLGTTPWQTDIEATLNALAKATYQGSTWGSTDTFNVPGKLDVASTAYFASNVGIGTTSAPTSPLSFAAAVGDKITLFNGLAFGFGVGTNLLEMYTHSVAADIAFGYDSSGTLMPRAFLDNGNGNFGVGTITPAARFDNRGTLRSGTTANYSEFEADGTLKFNGTATVWDDLRTPVQNLIVPATKNPAWGAFNGGQALFFDATTVAGNQEEVYFSLQMPHSWKEGSTSLVPHVHVSSTGVSNGDQVRWGLVYSWANIHSIFAAPTTVFAMQTAMGADDYHLQATFPAISGAGKTISSILMCKLYRNGASTLDTMAGDAILLEFDMHYEIDTVGSRGPSTK